jgi:hypothetical protein
MLVDTLVAPVFCGGTIMRETRATLPEPALIGGTRAALGAGLGLLLADRLTVDQRRAVGWTIFLVGALTTIPLAFEVLGGRRTSPHSFSRQPDGRSRLTPEEVYS